MAAVSRLSRLTAHTARWSAAWKTARWVVRQGRERLNRLSESERREFLDLMRKSRGRPSNLARHEKRRVQSLVKLLALGSR